METSERLRQTLHLLRPHSNLDGDQKRVWWERNGAQVPGWGGKFLTWTTGGAPDPEAWAAWVIPETQGIVPRGGSGEACLKICSHLSLAGFGPQKIPGRD